MPMRPTSHHQDGEGKSQEGNGVADSKDDQMRVRFTDEQRRSLRVVKAKANLVVWK